MDAELQSAIDAIDPRSLDYDEWLRLYAAMLDAGVPFDAANEWNRRDAERYDERTNGRKWESFRNPAEPDVARRTIFKAANATGWRWHGASAITATSHTATTPHKPEGVAYPLLDLTVPEGYTPPTPPDLEPPNQMLTQLAAMFYEGETVNTFVLNPKWNESRHKWEPVGHGECAKVGEFWGDGRAAAALGNANPEAGAWVRVNPMDGQGGSDRNVTAHRLALVEFDNMPKDMQLATYELLNLPCACIVDSGNKSVHAFVRIDARDAAEYRERVGWLYGLFEANGLQLDAANKNPARWARLAGARRGDAVQRLIATNAGAPSWDAWREWVAEHDTRTPETATETATTNAEDAEKPKPAPRLHIVREADHTGDLTPDATPAIIDGLLRRGHKMLITGPSKASKTWLLYGLGLSLATGSVWLDRHQCHVSRVLLVNTELDENSHHRRVDWIRRAFGMDTGDYADTLDSVTLRGLNMDAEGFVNELDAITAGARYDAVLLDSIYKLFDGVENDAHDVRLLFAQLDRLLAMGTSVIFTHHHAKGAAGGRDAIDRGSGSGVFGRDPDALLDLTPLVVEPDSAAWQYVRMHDYQSADGRTVSATALRLSYTLREFASPAPINLVFKCPTHQLDHNGELDGCKLRGSAQDYGSRGGQERARKYAERWDATDEALGRIVAGLAAKGETATRAACLDSLNEWRVANGMEPWALTTFTKETRPNGHLTWHPSLTPPYALERA